MKGETVKKSKRRLKKLQKTIISSFKKKDIEIENKTDFDIVPCIVVFNEEVRLKAWFDAHPFIKKICIIDQSSTDNTVQIIADESLKESRAIRLLKNIRFENFGEPDFNLLMKLTGKDAAFITAPDEFITEKDFKKLSEIVKSTFAEFGTRSFYISRKNLVDGICVNKMFVTEQDPDAKDWQLRISLGDSIQFQNTPHTHANPTHEWGYIADEVFLEHRKTLADERESCRKRRVTLSAQAVQRDERYIQALEEMTSNKEQKKEGEKNEE